MNSQTQPVADTREHLDHRRDHLDSSLKFLSSIKVGIVLMILLATATILGTVIVQKPMAEPGQIERLYSPQTRQLFELLGLLDVFHTSWFIALLALLCLNISFASIDRLPATWQYFRHPMKVVDDPYLQSLPLHTTLHSKEKVGGVEDMVIPILRQMGFKVTRTPQPGRLVLFGEKGRYSRLAVYLAHASLLIILSGAVVDSIYGYRAYLGLEEGETASRIELRSSPAVIELPFEVRCDAAGVEYYKDGTPSKWWSDLVVLEQGREVSRKHIIVNDPMDYRGIRFFQSSFGSTGVPKSFTLKLESRQKPGSVAQTVVMKRDQKVDLAELGVSLQPLDFIPDLVIHGQQIHSRSNDPNNPALLLNISAEGGSHWETWVFQKMQGFPQPNNLPFNIHLEDVQMKNFTGLQVAKQPGKNIIWAGCSLLVVGLIYSFYFSHQRIWVSLQANAQGESLFTLGGLSNKNKLGFARSFQTLAEAVSRGVRS